MNRTGFWWRIRYLWQAALVAVGANAQSRRLVVRTPPHPFYKRWWYRLKPQRALPPARPIALPPWVMPPEAELGVSVAARQVVSTQPGVVVGLTDCVAFSTGFQFGIAIRTKEEISASALGFGGAPPAATSTGWQLRVAVKFADGREAVTSGHRPGPEIAAYFSAVQEGKEPDLPAGPVIGGGEGGGGGKHWDFRYWVWPLPPDGPLTIVIEWHAAGIRHATHVMDGGSIRRAGATSKSIWEGRAGA